MLAVAGMPGRYLVLLVVGAVLVVLVALNLGLVKHYQIQRLTSFISPNSASVDVTYNVNQAKTAIAHGGIFGQGLFKGAQTNLAYVPEQQTDFIFSAVGEQLGFVGAGVLLVLYGDPGLADPAGGPAGQGRLRAPAVLRGVRPADVLGLRERGDEHGDHAGGRHPPPVPLLRRIGHDRLHGRHRHRHERALPEHPVTVPEPVGAGAPQPARRRARAVDAGAGPEPGRAADPDADPDVGRRTVAGADPAGRRHRPGRRLPDGPGVLGHPRPAQPAPPVCCARLESPRRQLTFAIGMPDAVALVPRPAADPDARAR